MKTCLSLLALAVAPALAQELEPRGGGGGEGGGGYGTTTDVIYTTSQCPVSCGLSGVPILSLPTWLHVVDHSVQQCTTSTPSLSSASSVASHLSLVLSCLASSSLLVALDTTANAGIQRPFAPSQKQPRRRVPPRFGPTTPRPLWWSQAALGEIAAAK